MVNNEYKKLAEFIDEIKNEKVILFGAAREEKGTFIKITIDKLAIF